MIIVLGSDGMLGRYIYDYFKKLKYDIRGLTRKNIDVTNLNKVREFIDTLNKDDCVINCMGVTNKRDDISITEMYTVNSIFPHLLDRGCHRRGSYLIHPSTDCVFTGENHSMIPTAEDDYGLSKSIGETLLYSMIIRVSIIGEEEKRKSNLLEWVRSNEGKEINGFQNHYWNGITCLQYAKLVHKIILNKEYWVGVKTFRSSYQGNEYIDKYSLLLLIKDIYNLNIKINPVITGNPQNRALTGKEVIVIDDLHTQIVEMKNYSFNSCSVTDLNGFKPIVDKNSIVFLVTSAIYPYCQNIFTPSDRLTQTLDTCTSIRKKVPNAIIILAEASPLKDSDIETLSKNCDYIVLFENMNRFGIDAKNMGEKFMTYNIVSKISIFSFLYKISGRYHLTDCFTEKIFSESKITYTVNDPNYPCMATVLYGIPYVQYTNYINALNKTLSSRLDIEHSLYQNLPPDALHYVDTINVCGYFGGHVDKLTYW